MEFRGTAPTDYETPTFVPGRKGLNWFAANDQLDPEEALYRRNLIQQRQGGLDTRPGQTTQFSGVGSLHSIARMDLPASAGFTRYWGGSTNWLRGAGAPAVLEGGFSGNPLTLLPYRPALSGDPWMIAADSAKMRQASATGASMELGLPAPATAAAAEIADILTTGIAAFDSSDSTAAANWTYTAGQDRSTTPVAADPPTGADVPGLSGDCVAFTTDPGAVAAGQGYSSILGRAVALDLTKLQGGTIDAGPDDMVHLWLRVDLPQLLEEVRVYFVCGSFDASVIPGTDPDFNTDAFVKAIRGSDITGFVENAEGSLAGNLQTRENQLVTEFLNEQALGLGPDTIAPLGGTGTVSPAEVAGNVSGPTQSSVQLQPGRDTWSEFGNVGRPLRRSEFARIGNQPDIGWNTITGIIIVIQTTTNEEITVSCDDWFLTGGYPLDTTEVTATPYDWRYTNYHLDTGDESNPSPEMDETAFLTAVRQRAAVTPVPYGDGRVRQKFYRRGGSLPTDWYFSGINDADGGEYVDDESDATVAAAGTLELDNDQPVTTVDSSGTTVRAQPLPAVFGPLGGRLCGVGDPKRPGHVYFSKVERGGSWPPGNLLEVCAPSEELLAGTLVGGIGFLLSRKRGYMLTSNLVNGALAVQETACQVGIASRWAWAQGTRGVYFVSADSDAPGIYLSAGQAALLLSQKIDPLFRGKTVTFAPGETVAPVDWTQPTELRLAIFQNVLWFLYMDTGGTRRTLCLNLLTEEWYQYDFAAPPRVVYAEEGAGLAPQLWLGTPAGAAALHTGTTDDGVAIACRVVTGCGDFGRPREDKQLGDVIFDADLPTATVLSLVCRLNNLAIANPASTWTGVSGRRRYQVDPFGTTPQRARNLQLDWAWSVSAASALFVAGASYRPLPDQVLKRATAWESFPTERYFWGMTLVCDTAGEDVDLQVEYTQGGGIAVAASVVLNADGRRLLQFSWPAVKADQIRIRAIGEDCAFWMLYKVEWLLAPEPPRIAGWDSTHENLGDTYYTGLDLECDTFGLEKTVEVRVDGVLLTNPATGGTTFPVTADGQQVVHLTFGPGRGHIYHFVATDASPGLLYSRKWHVEEEPSEQANWNQNYTVGGTLTGKSIKGVLIECDTSGQDKTVRVEGDGALLATLTVNHSERLVKHYAFPASTAKVLRLRPTDAHLSRPYSIQWVYDEEPLELSRWETQLVDHGLAGEHMVFSAQVTLRSTTAVDLTVEVYNNSGVLVDSSVYVLPSTGGAKQKLYVEFESHKGVLWKYTFTPQVADTRFSLYREESAVLVLPWGAVTPITRQPFGSDDLDKVRQMGNAAGIAQTPNNSPPAPLAVTAGLMSGGDGVTQGSETGA